MNEVDFDELINEVVVAAQNYATAIEWGSGFATAKTDLRMAKERLQAKIEALQKQRDEAIRQRDLLVKLIKDSKLVDIVSWRGRVGLITGLNSFWSDDLDDSDFDWLKELPIDTPTEKA